jgi:hypothetical protein
MMYAAQIASKAGRQSPSPEPQPDILQRGAPGSGKTEEEEAREKEREKELAGLESNPVHPLDRLEGEKFAKGGKKQEGLW